MKIKNNAEQVIREHYEEVEGEITLREYVECESQSDPDFFRWLFDDRDIEDFGINITSEQTEMFEDFLNNL
ncbi:MAG: hypothetical protein Q4F85_06280 [Prevotella sp.]|nr:hypothetical protein [Prevotella sp.]